MAYPHSSQRTTFWAFCCALALAHFAAAQQTENLLRNGGFEDGLTGWANPAVELIEDAKQAHAGSRCVAGTVEKKNQSRTIAQVIELDADRVYRLSFWLRSPERARSIIHVLYGKNSRIEVMELRRPPPKWQHFSATFAPRVSGEQTLRFAMPSAYGPNGDPGTVFLDDVELTSLAQAEGAVNLSNDDGYSDWPSMASDGQGTLWAAWTAYVAPDDDRGDDSKAYTPSGSDQLRGCVIRDGTPTPLSIPVKANDGIMWPHVAAGAEGAWLVWSMAVDGNWDIYAARLGEAGGSKTHRVTANAVVAAKGCGAVAADGSLWIAWEGNDAGNRDVYCAVFRDGSVTEPVKLSESTASDQNPTIGATASGDVFVAWDSFRDHNFDIYMKRHAGGQWSAEHRLTDQPILDRRPLLAASGDDVWLAWDNTIIPNYNMSNRKEKRVRVGKVVGGKLMAPAGQVRDAMLHTYVELPTLAVDGQGRLWVAMRKARGKRGDWDTWVQCYSGGKWDEPILASGSRDGITRRAPLACGGDTLYVAWQCDDRLNRPERIGYRGANHSNIFFAALDLAKVPPPAAPLELSDYRTAEQPNQLKEYRVRFNEDLAEPYSIEYQGERLNVYWGVFHEHTELSQCNARGDGSPDTNFAEARDIARLDFCALTDHGQDMVPYDWHHLQKITSINHDPRRFLAFLGEEWAGARKNLRDPERKGGGYGHRNIIFEDDQYPRYFDPVDNLPPDELWKQLKGVNQITIPHQLADGGSRTDWYYVDEKNQPIAEIFQNRGSYEYFGAPRQARIFTPGYAIQDQWAKGVVIGVIASPDHGGGGGKAAVLAPELTREAILDACRRRRTYGTTAAKVFMDVRVNGRLMGEVLSVPEGQPAKVSVNVVGAGKIRQVEVVKDNQFVYLATPPGREAQFVFEDTAPRQVRSFYYVRVIQDDGEIGWSSPVWVDK